MTTTITARSLAAFVAGIVVAALAMFVVADWRADAAPGDTDTTFVPITPCRLFDFRPGDPNVGPKSSPLGSNEIHQQQVSGKNGNCTLPNGIDAVSMNVTIVLPTAASDLVLYPADADEPIASNLNWVAGQSPTPNKVDVAVSDGGAIKMRNRFGQVYVLADVTGYYTDTSLDEIDQRLSRLESQPNLATLAGGDTGTNPSENLPVNGDLVEVVSVDVDVPRPGTVIVNSSAAVSDRTPGGKVFCSISDAFELQSPAQAWESAGAGDPAVDGTIGQLAGTRAFDVGPGTQTFRLVCQSATSSADPAVGNVSGAVLTYVFVAD